MKHAFIYIAVFSAMMLMTGCGDGSDSQSSTPQPTPVLPTSKSTISLAKDVPNATTTKIAEIVTPLGTTSATGGTVFTVEERSTVMALDKDGSIVMLGATNGNTPTILNVESTAIELVRLSWGQHTKFN